MTFGDRGTIGRLNVQNRIEMRFVVCLLTLWLAGVCDAQLPNLLGDRFLNRNVASSDLTSSDLTSSDLLGDVFDHAVCDADPEAALKRYKKQALQSASVSAGWLADVDGSQLSSRYIDVSIGSGIPLGSFDNIIGVKPRMRVDWIDAAPTIDIPDELYQFELQFFYRRPIHDRLSMMAIVSPSIRSDLTTSDNAFRVFALGLLNWQYIPDRLVLSAGAVYLGRADLPVLPAIGLRWTPTRFTRLDLQFPQSKFSYRLEKDGAKMEKWAYVSAGLGGNTWAVTRDNSQRDNSQTDELSLRDLRILLGAEKLLDGGGGWFAEAGYAFSRRIEYESDDSEVELGDAFVLQGGWRY